MLFEGPGFVIAIIAIITAGRLINNWIRAKHGYEPESKWNRKIALKHGLALGLPDSDETLRLKAENKALHDKVDTMQDRLVVLEKIVTDRGYSLAAEIEALRDAPVTAATQGREPV